MRDELTIPGPAVTRRGYLAYAAALAIGLGFVLWLLPLATLFPARPLDAVFDGDGAQAIIGQRYFLQGAWDWPLMLVRRLAEPGGINVAFTDSLPLALLPLKLFAGLLPPGFFIKNSWIAVVWTLQPAAAVFALRSAGERRFLPAMVVAVMSLSMPSLLVRFGQMSLCTHALLLFALGLYFRLVRGVRWGDGVACIVLLAAGLLVHPYLMVMSAALLAAAPLTLLLRRERDWVRCAVWVAGALLVTALLGAALGFGGSEPAPGYGVFSMNVLGPFIPGPKALVPFVIADPTTGQAFEGYQYLGAGLFLLIGAAVVAGVRGRVFGGWRDHAGLILVLVALTLMAVSTQAYLGGIRLTHIAQVRLPAMVLQFRASGRFFWPVSYALLIGSVVMVGRRWHGWGVAVLLLLAAGLQVADTGRQRADDRALADAPHAWAFDEGRVAALLAGSRELTLWPTDGCGIDTPNSASFMQMLLLGSETLIPTNTMYAARYEQAPVCAPGAVLGAPLRPGELRAIVPPARPGDRFFVPDQERACWTEPPMILCARERPAGAAPVAASLPLLETDHTYGHRDPVFQAALAEGWGPDGGLGNWSEGPVAALRFRLPPREGRVRFAATVAAVAPRPGGTQEVLVFADGQPVAQWTLPDLQGVPKEVDIPAGTTVLRFEVPHAIRPVDRGMNQDLRLLGLELRDVRFAPGPPVQ